jgi:catecholate siderophore receptor
MPTHTTRLSPRKRLNPLTKHLPTSALMLGATLAGVAPSWAQTSTPPPVVSDGKSLPAVRVEGAAVAPEGKDSVRATNTTIGKGKQALRDIPQSVTVVTERLIDDRNLDTMKEALKNTAGISFLAAEGGEEDIRLRGFSLQATGDVFIDGMRDPAFYERDTFNYDRMELLRGSASMLFGRGSTGGAVNQVSKQPRLLDENQVDFTAGSHNYKRLVLDLNKKLGDSTAVRLNAMETQADNNGSGSSLDKSGVALGLRWGIGEQDEFSFSLYHLDNRNGMNYGMPWVRPTATSPVETSTLLPLDPTAYYGMASDRNHGSASHGTFVHTRRISQDSELKTQLRYGNYTRDQRASTVRFGAAATQPGGLGVGLNTFGPNTVITRGAPLKIQDMQTVHAQSDLSTKYKALGMEHTLLAGVDVASENKVVYAARNAAQGGVVPPKPPTTVGTPNDGAWVDEESRILRVNNQYDSTSWGAYAQNMAQLTPHWKLVTGLRYDHLVGKYDSYGTPSATDNGPSTPYRMDVGMWSKRLGVLFQPNALHSYHVSAGTSFNTSGDAYSLGSSNVNTPPEQSINFELGAKLDSANKQFTTRVALFHATKRYERNTDPLLTVPAPTPTNPSATTPLVTLTGQRHVAGFEIDTTGRLTPKWEVYGSYMWIPSAQVDKAAPCPATGGCTQGAVGERPGDRPALTPRHSGTVWSTYQLTPQWRVGGGLNARSGQAPTRSAFSAPRFITGDLMAEYQFNDDLLMKLNISNVANKLYADQLYPGHYIPGAGRLVQLTASYKF